MSLITEWNKATNATKRGRFDPFSFDAVVVNVSRSTSLSPSPASPLHSSLPTNQPTAPKKKTQSASAPSTTSCVATSDRARRSSGGTRRPSRGGSRRPRPARKTGRRRRGKVAAGASLLFLLLRSRIRPLPRLRARLSERGRIIGWSIVCVRERKKERETEKERKRRQNACKKTERERNENLKLEKQKRTKGLRFCFFFLRKKKIGKKHKRPKGMLQKKKWEAQKLRTGEKEGKRKKESKKEENTKHISQCPLRRRSAQPPRRPRPSLPLRQPSRSSPTPCTWRGKPSKGRRSTRTPKWRAPRAGRRR